MNGCRTWTQLLLHPISLLCMYVYVFICLYMWMEECLCSACYCLSVPAAALPVTKVAQMVMVNVIISIVIRCCKVANATPERPISRCSWCYERQVLTAPTAQLVFMCSANKLVAFACLFSFSLSSFFLKYVCIYQAIFKRYLWYMRVMSLLLSSTATWPFVYFFHF